MNHLGISWEFADPKFDPEFIFNMVFIDNHKGEWITYDSIMNWMMSFYVTNDQEVMEGPDWICKLARDKEDIFPPIIKLWTKTGLLSRINPTLAIHTYRLEVEPRKIDQTALKKGIHLYLEEPCQDKLKTSSKSSKQPSKGHRTVEPNGKLSKKTSPGLKIIKE